MFTLVPPRHILTSLLYLLRVCMSSFVLEIMSFLLPIRISLNGITS